MKHIRWIWRFWQPHLKWLWILLFLTLLSSAVTLAFPRVIGILVDKIVELVEAGNPEEAQRQVWIYIGILAGIGIARTLSHFYPAFRALVNGKIEVDVRQKYFTEILGKGYKFFGKFRTGDLVTRLTDDIGGFPKIAWFSCSGIFRAVESTSKFLFCLAFMLTMNWQLSLLVIAPLPVMLGIFYLLRTALSRRSLERQRIISKTNDALESAFSGIRILKAFHCEEQQVKQFNTILNERIKVEFGLMKLWMGLSNLFMAIQFVGQVIVVVAGGLMVIDGTLTIGELVAFFVYVGLLLPPLMDIPNLFVTSRQAFACIDREIEIEETPGGMEHLKSGQMPVTQITRVELKQASFSYSEGLDPALDHIDMEISAGERIAVVGSVGSGKTTLIKLIAGLLPVQDGELLLNGLPLTKYDLPSYRRQVGYIPQEATLFSESVRGNVSFGRNLPLADVQAALGMAQVRDEMERLPKGIEQILGQRGMTVSGGQKQRLAIARALAGGPQLLLMDDCTSALDAENERAFWQEFSTRYPETACVIVTHRLATARHAGRIYVMDGGRIVGRGNHDELLESCDAYRNLLTKEELSSSFKSRPSLA